MDSEQATRAPFRRQGQIAILTPDLYPNDLFEETDDLRGADSLDEQDAPGTGPSLPIVLISAACGVAGGIFGLYISYGLLGLGPAVSAGAATVALLFCLGGSGAVLTAVMGARGALVNILFSCSLIVLVLLFMAMCMVVGAMLATLLLRS
jgi:hypothetical protein